MITVLVNQTIVVFIQAEWQFCSSAMVNCYKGKRRCFGEKG